MSTHRPPVPTSPDASGHPYAYGRPPAAPPIGTAVPVGPFAIPVPSAPEAAPEAAAPAERFAPPAAAGRTVLRHRTGRGVR